MKEFTISDKTREILSRDLPRTKSAISILANSYLHISNPPQGIFKFEGGVWIKGREICIKYNCVMDDWTRSSEATKEEIAVVKAIEDIDNLYRVKGKKELKLWLDKFTPCTSGDPLRSFSGA